MIKPVQQGKIGLVNQAKQYRRMRAEVRRLKGYLGRVMRDLERKSKVLGIEHEILSAKLEQAKAVDTTKEG